MPGFGFPSLVRKGQALVYDGAQWLLSLVVLRNADLTVGRIPKASTIAALTDSQIADGVTGNVATFQGALTGGRAYTLQDASGTVALLQIAQTWTAGQVIGTDPTTSSSLRVQGTGFFGGSSNSQASSASTGTRTGTDINGDPYIAWIRTTNGVDAKVWDVLLNGNALYFRLVNDAYNSAINVLTLTRSGTVFTGAYFGADPGGSEILRLGGGLRASGASTITDTTDSTSTTTGSLVLAGGLAVAKAVNAGTAIKVSGNLGTGDVFPLSVFNFSASITGRVYSLLGQSANTSNCGWMSWYPTNQEFGLGVYGGGEIIRMKLVTGTYYLGFFNSAPIQKPTVTGSKGGNAALASLMTALANLGLVTDSTT